MKKNKQDSNSFNSGQKQEIASIANAPKEKKISFFAAMMIVVGSSVGAGIFLRSQSVLNNAQGSLPLAILSWLVAAFAVISMALSLIEIASARNDNLSLIGWCKTFNSRYIYKASKNFMFYIYTPLTFFFMPLYVVLQLQDAIGVFTHTTVTDGVVDLLPFEFGTNVDWLIWTAISIAISLYFIISVGLSSRLGNIQNLAITSVKFIPLLVAAFIGYAFIAMNPDTNIGVAPDPTNPDIGYDPTRFSTFSPGFGMFLAIAGIFFAYDGFYVTAGLQTEMKEPKKTPLAILLGLVIVTVIYLAIAISMSLNGSGSFFAFGEWLVINNLSWLFGLVNILISIGILGIINGFAMWAPRFIEDLIREDEVPFSHKFKNKLNASKPKIGIMYTLVISIPVIVLFTLIGSLAFEDTTGYGTIYGSGMDTLYSFADITANWTALFAFGFIGLSIYGGLRNRKSKKIETQQNKYFVPFGIISVALLSITLFVTLITPIIDLMLIYVPDANIDTTGLIGRIMLVIVLILFLAIMFVPTFIEDYLNKNKKPSQESERMNLESIEE